MCHADWPWRVPAHAWSRLPSKMVCFRSRDLFNFSELIMFREIEAQLQWKTNRKWCGLLKGTKINVLSCTFRGTVVCETKGRLSRLWEKCTWRRQPYNPVVTINLCIDTPCKQRWYSAGGARLTTPYLIMVMCMELRIISNFTILQY